MAKKTDFTLFLKFIFIFILFFAIAYLIISFVQKEGFSDYKSYEMDPNKKVKVENRFTNDSNCSSQDVSTCSKFGKLAINNFNNNDGGCMCADVESGV